MNGLQTVSHWDDFFGNPRGASLGLMGSIMSLGSICSTPIAPWVADKYGRRWGITVGSCIMIIGAIIQCKSCLFMSYRYPLTKSLGESVNFAMFVVSRFILGFGLSFATTAAPSLVSELSHPQDRVTVSAICNTWYALEKCIFMNDCADIRGNSWFLGSIAAAWITYGTRRIPSTWSWRITSLLQMAPSVLQLATIWFLPESPRWLVSQDRDDAALDALKRDHGEGEASELVKLEYEEIRNAIDNEKSTFYLNRLSRNQR